MGCFDMSTDEGTNKKLLMSVASKGNIYYNNSNTNTPHPRISNCRISN